jgi:hypothetical protein
MTWVALAPALAIVIVLAVATLVARRAGYRLGGRTIVRCRSGHLFTSIWVPGGSFKAIRLGWVRFQYCPIGQHWTLVVPVRDEDLTDAERWQAEQWRDAQIP